MESSHAKENSKLLAALQSLSLNDSADSSNLDKFNQLLHEEASKYSFKSTIKSLLNSLYHLLTSSRQFIFINHSAFKKVNWAALIPVLEQIVVANPSCLPSYEKWLFDQTYKPSIKKDAFQLLGELYLQCAFLCSSDLSGFIYKTRKILASAKEPVSQAMISFLGILYSERPELLRNGWSSDLAVLQAWYEDPSSSKAMMKRIDEFFISNTQIWNESISVADVTLKMLAESLCHEWSFRSHKFYAMLLAISSSKILNRHLSAFYELEYYLYSEPRYHGELFDLFTIFFENGSDILKDFFVRYVSLASTELHLDSITRLVRSNCLLKYDLQLLLSNRSSLFNLRSKANCHLKLQSLVLELAQKLNHSKQLSDFLMAEMARSTKKKSSKLTLIMRALVSDSRLIQESLKQKIRFIASFNFRVKESFSMDNLSIKFNLDLLLFLAHNDPEIFPKISAFLNYLVLEEVDVESLFSINCSFLSQVLKGNKFFLNAEYQFASFLDYAFCYSSLALLLKILKTSVKPPVDVIDTIVELSDLMIAESSDDIIKCLLEILEYCRTHSEEAFLDVLKKRKSVGLFFFETPIGKKEWKLEQNGPLLTCHVKKLLSLINDNSSQTMVVIEECVKFYIQEGTLNDFIRLIALTLVRSRNFNLYLNFLGNCLSKLLTDIEGKPSSHTSFNIKIVILTAFYMKIVFDSSNVGYFEARISKDLKTSILHHKEIFSSWFSIITLPIVKAFWMTKDFTGLIFREPDLKTVCLSLVKEKEYLFVQNIASKVFDESVDAAACRAITNCHYEDLVKLGPLTEIMFEKERSMAEKMLSSWDEEFFFPSIKSAPATVQEFDFLYQKTSMTFKHVPPFYLQLILDGEKSSLSDKVTAARSLYSMGSRNSYSELYAALKKRKCYKVAETLLKHEPYLSTQIQFNSHEFKSKSLQFSKNSKAHYLYGNHLWENGQEESMAHAYISFLNFGYPNKKQKAISTSRILKSAKSIATSSELSFVPLSYWLPHMRFILLNMNDDKIFAGIIDKLAECYPFMAAFLFHDKNFFPKSTLSSEVNSKVYKFFQLMKSLSKTPDEALLVYLEKLYLNAKEGKSVIFDDIDDCFRTACYQARLQFLNRTISIELNQLKEGKIATNNICNFLKSLISKVQKFSLKYSSLEMDEIVCEEFSSIKLPSVLKSEELDIVAIQPKVICVASKTRPKKVVFELANGTIVEYLVKSNEDLEIDFFVSKALSIMDNLIDPKNSIRIYNIVPLGRELGMLEIIGNITSCFSLFKSTLEYCRADRALPMKATSRFYENVFKIAGKGIVKVPRNEWPVHVLKGAFLQLCKETPDNILKQFIHQSSRDWKDLWENQKSYTNSFALNTLFGYILGIGDRHLDNILIDKASMELISIDLSVCLNKGRSLRIPELVPVRLTRNFVSALDVSGLFGRFKSIFLNGFTKLEKYRDIAGFHIDEIEKISMSDKESCEEKEFLRFDEEEDNSSQSLYDNQVSKRATEKYVNPLLLKSPSESVIPLAGLSANDHFESVTKSSVDSENLCKMYEGWMPWF